MFKFETPEFFFMIVQLVCMLVTSVLLYSSYSLKDKLALWTILLIISSTFIYTTGCWICLVLFDLVHHILWEIHYFYLYLYVMFEKYYGSIDPYYFPAILGMIFLFIYLLAGAFKDVWNAHVRPLYYRRFGKMEGIPLEKEEEDYHFIVHKRNVTEYLPERMVPNNVFQRINKIPAFQAEVYGFDDNKWYLLGQCFWVDEGIITASHVIDNFDLLRLRTENGTVDLNRTDFEDGEGDFAVCKEVSEVTRKLPGLCKARLNKLAVTKNSGLMAQCVGNGQKSFGGLDESPNFGVITYTGSTVKGFSGAPYYVNKTIFGMHIGSQNDVNIGYDAAFLRTCLNPTRKIVANGPVTQESSDEWLMDQAERFGNDVIYTRSPYNPDEYRVKVGNMYHFVDEEVVRRMKERGGKRAQVIVNNYDEETCFINPKKTTKEEKTREEIDLIQLFGKSSMIVECDKDKIVNSPLPLDPKVYAERPVTSKEVKQTPRIINPVQAEPAQSVLTPVVMPAIPPALPANEVDNLPLCPRTAMTFEDQGNLIRAPTGVTVGARGPVIHPSAAQHQNLQPYNQMGYAYQQHLAPYHMESPMWMPAQLNAASRSTAKNNRKVRRNQTNWNELQRYRRQFGPIQNGRPTSQAPMTARNGSTQNSGECSQKSTTTAPQGTVS